jgi:hypothetical protein
MNWQLTLSADLIYVEGIVGNKLDQFSFGCVSRQDRSDFCLLLDHGQIQFFQYVLDTEHHLGAIVNQTIASCAASVQDVSRHGKDFTSLIGSKVYGDERAAPDPGLDNDDAQ